MVIQKAARKPSADSGQEKLRQSKALWNKEVSAFINDLIHFKKMMNGWPSKFFKERSRITQPIPADPATIIGSLAGDFQEIAQKGNSLIQEQINYAKNRRQQTPKTNLNPAPPSNDNGTPPQEEAPTAPKTDLSQQLSQGVPVAASEDFELFKLASAFDSKYALDAQASNPISRFITRLFNPKFGFGEGARLRRLRMTMLDNCVKSYKAIKKLHKEIVGSSKESVVNSHKLMTFVWNYWNIVNRLFSAYKTAHPGEVKDFGGKIEDPELKRENALMEGQDPDELGQQMPSVPMTEVMSLIQDYNSYSNYMAAAVKNPQLAALMAEMEKLKALPKNKKPSDKILETLKTNYGMAINAANQELGTQGKSFKEILEQYNLQPKKEAQVQRYLGKVRHELIPGATSGSRLEVYELLEKIRIDLDSVMNLLEEGFDQNKLSTAINQVNREMVTLRTMIRSLYYSEKPEEASSPFF